MARKILKSTHNLGRSIEKKRTDSLISKKELCAYCGMGIKKYNSFLTNTSSITTNSVFKICEYLKLEMAALDKE